MKPDFQGVTAHWNRAFMAFQQAQRARVVMLVMPE
jgi:hypothetical protein